MNPAFVTTSFSPNQWTSGISNALYLVVKQLYEKHSVRSTVFAPFDFRSSSGERVDCCDVRRFPAGRFFSPSLLPLLRSSHAKQKFSFVHSYHYGFYPAAAGFAFARSSALPHFHTAAYHPPSSLKGRMLMPLYNARYGKPMLSSSVVFPFNRNEKTQLSSISPANYKVVPCPVNDDIFRPSKSKFSRQTVAYIGTLLPWKGPLVALQIFERLSASRQDVDFVLLGNGPLEAGIRQRISSKRIRLLTGLPPEKVASVLAKSDVVVCPTAYESFGSAIAEALMCGTPVVSTTRGAVPETVGPAGLLSEYGDWQAMQSNIEQLIDDNRMRKRLALLAIKHSSNYRYGKVAENIYKIYAQYLK